MLDEPQRALAAAALAADPNVIADVLAGDREPLGHLPVTLGRIDIHRSSGLSGENRSH